MGRRKKENKKNAGDYKQRQLYFDNNVPYQDKAYQTLLKCGHKQSRFVGLLIYDFLNRFSIDIESVDEKQFAKIIDILDLQILSGLSVMPATAYRSTGPQLKTEPIPAPAPTRSAVNSAESRNISTEVVPSSELADMNAALAAFGV